MGCDNSKQNNTTYHSHKLDSVPYSEAVQVGDMLYISGQIANLEDDYYKIVDGGIRPQVNQTMKNHLGSITSDIKKILKFKISDYVLDIASNDATLLKSYRVPKINYVGIDPTISKFKKFYPNSFKTSPSLFNKAKYLQITKTYSKYFKITKNY